MTTIRPFQPSDADALADLFHASVREVARRHYTLAQVTTWSPDRPEPGIYLTRAKERIVLVAEAEGVPVGYGDLEMDGHIDHLYCRPDHVGTGTGSAIYRALEAAARHAGIDRLHVEASEAARRMFLRHGFQVDGRNDIVIRGISIHNYRMSKVLTLRA